MYWGQRPSCSVTESKVLTARLLIPSPYSEGTKREAIRFVGNEWLKSCTVDLHSLACASVVETLRSNVVSDFRTELFTWLQSSYCNLCRKCTAVWVKWTAKYKNLTTATAHCMVVMRKDTKCVLAHDHNAMRWVKVKKLTPTAASLARFRLASLRQQLESVSSSDYSTPVATLHYLYKEKKQTKK